MKLLTINPSFTYTPFPYAFLSDVFEESIFHELVNTFPSVELFQKMDSLGEKFSLSEVNNPKQYFQFLEENSLWKEFYNDIKSEEFLIEVISLLKNNNIDLMLDDLMPSKANTVSGWLKQIKRKRFPNKLKSRFEFSSMPANGGCIYPHTDATNKVITLVIYMNNEKYWDEGYGGETSICETVDSSNVFNLKNEYFDFDKVKKIRDVPVKNNSGNLFIKTFNSWHCVFPMQGPAESLRNTLTINIET